MGGIELEREIRDLLDSNFEKEFLKNIHFMVWDIIVESPFPIIPNITLSRVEKRGLHILQLELTSYNIHDRLERYVICCQIPFTTDIDYEEIGEQISQTIALFRRDNFITDKQERMNQNKLFNEYIKYR